MKSQAPFAACFRGTTAARRARRAPDFYTARWKRWASGGRGWRRCDRRCTAIGLLICLCIRRMTPVGTAAPAKTHPKTIVMLKFYTKCHTATMAWCCSRVNMWCVAAFNLMYCTDAARPHTHHVLKGADVCLKSLPHTTSDAEEKDSKLT